MTKGTFDDHINQLRQVFRRLQAAGLKVNAKKCSFSKEELEYLGYWITRDTIQPMPNKVEAILKLQPPTNRTELRHFIGLVNYYRDMWSKRSHYLAPLTALTSSKRPFHWEPMHQRSFEAIKSIVSREVMLTYPDFSKKFIIHTDASKYQLGAVIAQEGKPIAYFSRKLSPAQMKYTTGELELLSIIETLKEFRTILLGQQIVIYTDHKNLLAEKSENDRIHRWKLFLQEYGLDIQHVKGATNESADALSRLPTHDLHVQQLCSSAEANADLFGLSKKELEFIFPMHPSILYEYQK